MLRLSYDRWNVTRITHVSLNAFLDSNILGKAIHTIYGESEPIDIYCDIEIGRPLLLSFHGGLSHIPDLTIPSFSGVALAKSVSASLIAFSDPSLTLNPGMTCGWFGGSKSLRLQLLLRNVLAKVATATSPSKCVVFGGSSGGFAALYYSRFLPDSICLIWNPQLRLLAVNSQYINHYAKYAFGLHGREEVESQLATFICHDLTTDLNALATGPRVIYLQNSSDIHIERHLAPLIQSFTRSQSDPMNHDTMKAADRFSVFVGNWGEGHCPPPRSLIFDLIHLLCSDSVSWQDNTSVLLLAMKSSLEKGGHQLWLHNDLQILR
jgi:hypothetical protein